MEIIGYKNYLIYDDGRIWSNNVKRFLKPELDKDGYERIYLRANNKRRKFMIHRLVAEYYLINPNNYPTVDHIDRCKTNNNISNLRWASLSTQNINKNWRGNISGHKYLYFTSNCWNIYIKRYNISKCFKNKIEALCYKYIIQLRIKANHY